MARIVSLFATAAMADDGMALAKRALPQDDFRASGSPVRFDVALLPGT